MEKFRAFLESLKKYHFWVLCGLIVLFSFGAYFLAVSAEELRYATRTKAIDGTFKTVQGISATQDHPSRKYIEQILDITSGSLTTQVETAANRLYDEQHKNNPLPIVFADKNDQARFEDEFGKIWGRMEDIEKLPPDKLAEFYRSRYRYHIAEHFPKLFELIERRTEVVNTDDPGAAAASHGRTMPMGIGGGGNPDRTKQYVGIVDWEDADQKIKTFRERFTSSEPTTLDIMMAQEELWIYETLLKVIRNTNDVGTDPTHRDPKQYKKPASHKVARIKQILAMDIGKDAIQNWSTCDKALINLPSEGSAEGGRGGPPPSMQAMTIGRGSAGSGGSPGVSPLAGRYVDEKGKPLADPAQQPFNEFRMMPINLKVIIEQKDIPRLLAECANSAMRIDVRSVRILVDKPPPLELTSADAPGAAGGETRPGPISRESMMGMRQGGMGGRDESSGGGGEFVYNEESSDPVYPPVPVEVQGIIYIYNPPMAQNPGTATADNTIQAGRSAVVPTTGVPAGAAPAAGTPASMAVPGTAAPAIPAVTTSPAHGAVPLVTGPIATPPATPLPAVAAPGAPAATGSPKPPPTTPSNTGGRP